MEHLAERSAAHGPMTRSTPSCFIAHRFARYGTLCGGNWCFMPCRGMNATERPSTRPTVTGAEGFPHGVSTSTSRTSSKNE